MDTVPATALDSTLPLMLDMLMLMLMLELVGVLAIVLALPDALPAGVELAPAAQPAVEGRSVTPAVSQSWSAKVMVAGKARRLELIARRITAQKEKVMFRDVETYRLGLQHRSAGQRSRQDPRSSPYCCICSRCRCHCSLCCRGNCRRSFEHTWAGRLGFERR